MVPPPEPWISKGAPVTPVVLGGRVIGPLPLPLAFVVIVPAGCPSTVIVTGTLPGNPDTLIVITDPPVCGIFAGGAVIVP